MMKCASQESAVDCSQASQSFEATQVFEPTQDAFEEDGVEGGDVEQETPWSCGLIPLPGCQGYQRTDIVRIDLTGETATLVIGRNRKCDVQISDNHVSSYHCQVMCTLERGGAGGTPVLRAHLKDQSSNGTFVNGTRIPRDKPFALSACDVISVISPYAESKRSNVAAFMFTVTGPASENSGSREATSYPVAAASSAGTASRKSKSTALGLAASPQSSDPSVLAFFERYKILEQLGRGTYATVHLAMDQSTGELKAIKSVDVQGSLDDWTTEELIQDAETEARMQRGMQHDNIVRVFEHYADRERERVYIVMEYMPGGELFMRLKNNGAMTETQTREIMLQLVDAVQYIHSQNVTHRDLKPANILMQDDQSLRVKITDFGVAKQKLSGIKTYTGSPMYFAPEVFRRRDTVCGRGTYSHISDMWSLGVIMYNLLTARNPWSVEQFMKNPETISFDIEREKPWPSISDSAKDFISGLLEGKTRRRMTAKQALEHPWLSGAPVDESKSASVTAAVQAVDVGVHGTDAHHEKDEATSMGPRPRPRPSSTPCTQPPSETCAGKKRARVDQPVRHDQANAPTPSQIKRRRHDEPVN